MKCLHSCRTCSVKNSRCAAHTFAQHFHLAVPGAIIDDRPSSAIYRDSTSRTITHERDEQRFSPCRLHHPAMRPGTQPRSRESYETWMRRRRLDPESITTSKTCELVADDSLRRTHPCFDRMVEQRTNCSSRMQEKVSSNIGKAHSRSEEERSCVQ